MRRGYPVTFVMRGERRAKAEARQAEYDKLSLEQKLAKVPANGGKKERAKLEAKIHAVANKAITDVKAEEAGAKKPAKAKKNV